MIEEIQIENFKSISKLTLKPGRVTVLIGENGSGKSNILEAIAFAAAASADKLDDEFLFTRGIRVTDENWMTSAFSPEPNSNNRHDIEPTIRIVMKASDLAAPVEWRIIREAPDGLHKGNGWSGQICSSGEEIASKLAEPNFPRLLKEMAEHWFGRDADSDKLKTFLEQDEIKATIAGIRLSLEKNEVISRYPSIIQLRDFLIYSPENSALRSFHEEGAIKPLGTRGQGLLKLLQSSRNEPGNHFADALNKQLQLLSWLENIQLPSETDAIQGRLGIKDRWLVDNLAVFDQRSANEGFLYLLFYFTLFLSRQTPAFFAVDNLENALNPKLCAELMRTLTGLARENDKQAIFTTHNPAILDGLNLKDDSQRLYVVRRDSKGRTVVNRVSAPRPRPDGKTMRLSEAFMSGMLGGLPEHF